MATLSCGLASLSYQVLRELVQFSVTPDAPTSHCSLRRLFTDCFLSYQGVPFSCCFASSNLLFILDIVSDTLKTLRLLVTFLQRALILVSAVADLNLYTLAFMPH